MNENIKKISSDDEKISIEEMAKRVISSWRFLLRNWIIILFFVLGGATIGLFISLLTKPKYTASLSFALVEKSSGGSGLADLASSFGFSGLIGGNNGAFSGDNLLEIIKSRYAIEQTLLTPVIYKGERENLVEVYIQFNQLREKWSKNTMNVEMQNLTFPVGQKRETFTRTQDSVLFNFYNEIVASKELTVVRKDKKISIVNVDFTSNNELFSKLFVEKLMDETYRFYSETRTSQSRANINMMQAKADSIKNLYESALYKSAGYSQININPALQFAAVPKIKQENNAQLYATVYAEVLKNLETLKLDLARETPIVQIIDTPRFPLKKDKFGKSKGIVFGGIMGGFLIVSYLFVSAFIKGVMKKNYNV